MAQAAPMFYYAATAVAVAGVAYADYKSGIAQQEEYAARAEEEKMAAKDREIQRRNKLLQALAQRNVSSASSGTALEGTDIALVNRDFSEYSIDSLTNEAMTAARVESLNRAGSNAKAIGTIKGVSGLIGAAGAVAGGIGAAKLGAVNSPALKANWTGPR